MNTNKIRKTLFPHLKVILNKRYINYQVYHRNSRNIQVSEFWLPFQNIIVLYSRLLMFLFVSILHHRLLRRIRKTFSAGASDGKYSWCRQNILYDDDYEEIWKEILRGWLWWWWQRMMMDLRCERWEKFEHRCPPMPHSYKKLMDLEMMMMVMMMMMTLPTIINYMKDINWSGNNNHHHSSFILIMIRTSQMFWRYDDGDDMWWFMERLKVLKWWARSSLSWVGVVDHIRAALRQITSAQHPQPPLAS